MIGFLTGLRRLFSGEWEITFRTKEDFSLVYDELSKEAVTVDIKKARKHRSLSANAYAWVLIDLITAKQQDLEKDGGWTPEKVYKNAIKEIGGISDLYGVKEEEFERFKELWCKGHIGRQVEIVPGSQKPGWINVRAWKGSSDFDTQQMSRLISNLIQDAESLGIPTITEKEYQKMLGKWAA